MNGTPTVVVRVKDVYGIPTVYPVNDAAMVFARITGKKTITLATMRGIRELGYAVETLAGELPPGF